MAKNQKYVSQAAVVAVRNGRVCLITSSSGKQWLVPKGNLQKGRDLRETAAQEAWEAVQDPATEAREDRRGSRSAQQLGNAGETAVDRAGPHVYICALIAVGGVKMPKVACMSDPIYASVVRKRAA
jgi:hypothetical protein